MGTVRSARPDPGVLATFVGLLAFGLCMVWSASTPTSVHWGHGIFHVLRNQGAFALASCLLAIPFFVGARKPTLVKLVNLFYVLSAALTCVTQWIGVKTLGATRWIQIGSITLQPSELLKPMMVLWVAKRCLEPHDTPRAIFLTTAGLLVPLGAVVVGQSDLGTGLCLAAGAFITGLMAGMPLWIVLGTLFCGVAGVGAIFLGGGYRATRIHEWLQIGTDHPGPPTQAEQSLMAIGHGGLLGEGWGLGTQKFGHLPIAHTDFIFAIVAEEFGYLGGVFLIATYLFLVVRALHLARRVEDPFARAAIVGLAGGITCQALLNIGVAVALLPVTGVPLPFISLGGSSMLGGCISIGLCLGLAARTERRRKARAPFATEETA